MSEINRIEGRGGNRFGGYYPASGAHMADGMLYTGFYPYQQCISKEVVLHHDAMCENRKQGGGVSTRKGSMTKRTAELRAQISELESTKRRIISEMKTRPSEDNKPKSGGVVWRKCGEGVLQTNKTRQTCRHHCIRPERCTHLACVKIVRCGAVFRHV